MKYEIFIATLFPEIFPGPLAYGITKRALHGQCKIVTIDLRNIGPHIDGRPCGGGAGMIMRADFLEKIMEKLPPMQRYIFPTPSGYPMTQKYIESLLDSEKIFILCGRYEGVDERFLEHYNFDRVSMGDFILSGGEIPALALLDAFIRLLPDVLNNPVSIQEESFQDNLLEFDQFTLPRIWRGKEVPEILQTGHHLSIKKWRLNSSLKKTHKYRPDLFRKIVIYLLIWYYILYFTVKKYRSK